MLSGCTFPQILIDICYQMDAIEFSDWDSSKVYLLFQGN